jgi:hypothetical protein
MPNPFSPLGELVPDRTAINVCSTANIELMSNKRVRLTQIGQSLQASVAETERAAKRDELLSRALLTANLIKATCEAFLDMAGALGEAAGLKGTGSVSKLGIAGMAIAGSTASSRAGLPTDWVSTGNKVAGVFVDQRMKAGNAKSVMELQTVKVDLINSAVRGDNVGALQGIFLGYLPKIAEMSLDMMKKETAAKWTSAASSVANAGYSYSRALDEAFNTRIADRVELSDRKSSLLATTYRLISQIKQRIGEIDTIMQQCATGVAIGRLT